MNVIEGLFDNGASKVNTILALLGHGEKALQSDTISRSFEPLEFMKKPDPSVLAENAAVMQQTGAVDVGAMFKKDNHQLEALKQLENAVQQNGIFNSPENIPSVNKKSKKQQKQHKKLLKEIKQLKYLHGKKICQNVKERAARNPSRASTNNYLYTK